MIVECNDICRLTVDLFNPSRELTYKIVQITLILSIANNGWNLIGAKKQQYSAETLKLFLPNPCLVPSKEEAVQLKPLK